ncbi:MAG: hypothetical protein O7J95_13925 [Planctomycetota bacterium]|nr:hypothetical protein [Planctomycetota bacterium]
MRRVERFALEAALLLFFACFLTSCIVTLGTAPPLYRSEPTVGQPMENLSAPQGFFALDLKSANLPHCARCGAFIEGRPNACPRCAEPLTVGRLYDPCSRCGGRGLETGSPRCRDCRGIGVVRRTVRPVPTSR